MEQNSLRMTVPQTQEVRNKRHKVFTQPTFWMYNQKLVTGGTCEFWRNWRVSRLEEREQSWELDRRRGGKNTERPSKCLRCGSNKLCASASSVIGL